MALTPRARMEAGLAELATISGRSDREVATDLKARVRVALEGVAALMDEANRSGMQVQFQIGLDGFGRNVVASLNVVRVL